MKRISRVAMAAAALALAVPMSGCAAMLSAQQTAEYQYNGGDGAWADFGEVAVRGLMLVANDEGAANLTFTVVNNSEEAAQVEISVGDADVSQSVPAGETFAQVPAAEGTEPIIANDIGGETGSLVDVEVTVNGESETVRTQVLSGALPEYEDLVPTSGAETPAAADEGTAEETAEAAETAEAQPAS